MTYARFRPRPDVSRFSGFSSPEASSEDSTLVDYAANEFALAVRFTVRETSDIEADAAFVHRIAAAMLEHPGANNIIMTVVLRDGIKKRARWRAHATPELRRSLAALLVERALSMPDRYMSRREIASLACISHRVTAAAAAARWTEVEHRGLDAAWCACCSAPCAADALTCTHCEGADLAELERAPACATCSSAGYTYDVTAGWQCEACHGMGGAS